MDVSDAELIAAVLAGNSASFEPLVVKYQPRVFATARRYARRESEVEDIVQEVFSSKRSKNCGVSEATRPLNTGSCAWPCEPVTIFYAATSEIGNLPLLSFRAREKDWLEKFQGRS